MRPSSNRQVAMRVHRWYAGGTETLSPNAIPEGKYSMYRCQFMEPSLPRLCHLASIVLATALFSSVVSAEPTATTPEKVPLWSGSAPIGDGQTETAQPTITVHQPAAGKANGAAMVICPGGGYGGLVVGAEGHGIAQWLVRHGITGIVLEYRLPKGRSFVPLLDAQRAIRMARFKAADWKLDPKRIGIIGFSAAVI